LLVAFLADNLDKLSLPFYCDFCFLLFLEIILVYFSVVGKLF